MTNEEREEALAELEQILDGQGSPAQGPTILAIATDYFLAEFIEDESNHSPH